MAMSLEIKTIRTEVIHHKVTGLLIAISDDLPGLMVSGRSEEELRRRIPGAIKELLEAQGYDVTSIEPTETDSDIPNAFRVPSFIINASIEAAATQ